MLNFYGSSIHLRLPALKLITEQTFWLLIWLMIQQKLACKNLYFLKSGRKRFLYFEVPSYWQFLLAVLLRTCLTIKIAMKKI